MATFSNEESCHLELIRSFDNDKRQSLSEISSCVPSLFDELDPLRNHIPIQRAESSDQQDNMNNTFLSETRNALERTSMFSKRTSEILFYFQHFLS